MCISHRFRGRKSEIRAPARLGSGEGTLRSCRPLTFHCSMRCKERALVSSSPYKDPNPILEGFSLMTSSPPEGPTSQYHHMGGGRLQHWNSGGTQTFSLEQEVWEAFSLRAPALGSQSSDLALTQDHGGPKGRLGIIE